MNEACGTSIWKRRQSSYMRAQVRQVLSQPSGPHDVAIRIHRSTAQHKQCLEPAFDTEAAKLPGVRPAPLMQKNMRILEVAPRAGQVVNLGPNTHA